MSGYEKLGELLSTCIPKEFLLGWEAAAASALERAAALGSTSSSGHRSHVVGQMRHYLLNEAFDQALSEAGLAHTPLSGNRIVVGSAGITFLARVHVNQGPWDNSRRSVGKLKLCAKNIAATAMVQPDFLRSEEPPIEELTCLFVTEHSGSMGVGGALYIVVTDPEMDMKSPLFKEPLAIFLQRYEKKDATDDRAIPRLKTSVQVASDPVD